MTHNILKTECMLEKGGDKEKVQKQKKSRKYYGRLKWSISGFGRIQKNNKCTLALLMMMTKQLMTVQNCTVEFTV